MHFVRTFYAFVLCFGSASGCGPANPAGAAGMLQQLTLSPATVSSVRGTPGFGQYDPSTLAQRDCFGRWCRHACREAVANELGRNHDLRRAHLILQRQGNGRNECSQPS